MFKYRKNIIFHIDVNCAYLSWEAVYRLSHGETLDIRDVPSVVGGSEKSRHGIVLAKSYPAKKYGIVTGETIQEARRKCPHLLVVPPRGDIYEKASQAMFDLLLEYSDNVQKYSIDEGFIDFSDNEKVLRNPYACGEEIRKRIENELGFTVCVGIGENKVMAKMAGELKKPNFTNTLYNDEIQKLWDLPVGELFMVGRKTEEKLVQYGITTIGKLANTDLNFLKRLLHSHGETIWTYANGNDYSIVKKTFSAAKSCGHSSTLPYNLDNEEQAKVVFMGLIEKVCTRLRSSKQVGSVVTISIKNTDRIVTSHQKKILSKTNNSSVIFGVAMDLFKEVWKGEPLRAVGISMSNLENEELSQISLFDTNLEQVAKLDKTIDEIRDKYGKNKIVRANQLNNHTYRRYDNKEFLHKLSVTY